MMAKKDLLSKELLSFFVVPLSLAAAILSLLVTLFLIITNPSRSPAMVKSAKEQSEVVGYAKRDLANRIAFPLQEITLSSISKVQWPDGSLGCPKKGMMYVQMVILGYKIILTADGKNYDYRTDLEGNIILLCAPQLPIPTPRELQ